MNGLLTCFLPPFLSIIFLYASETGDLRAPWAGARPHALLDALRRRHAPPGRGRGGPRSTGGEGCFEGAAELGCEPCCVLCDEG